MYLMMNAYMHNYHSPLPFADCSETEALLVSLSLSHIHIYMHMCNNIIEIMFIGGGIIIASRGGFASSWLCQKYFKFTRKEPAVCTHYSAVSMCIPISLMHWTVESSVS